MKINAAAETPSADDVAYSYVRFSHPDQAKGDSLRRQTEAALAWCEQHGVRLDTTTTLHDLGTSAYLGEHRKNADRHALAAFLKLVEVGKIPKGSYLIIENLDRLSREEERPALRLWMDILDAGVNIVQLSPETIFRHEKSDMFDIMRAIMELSRGHGESAIKSERVGAAWADKKDRARRGLPQPEKKQNRVNGMAILTHCLPAWVEERGGKLELIPARAAVVKRIYHLAADGYGSKTTATLLIREQVPAFGSAGHWNGSYIRAILADRRAAGEFQPKQKRGRVKDGDPIPNYFPAVVGEDEWAAARAGAVQRRKNRGRIGEYVNVFAGLLKDARDGGGYHATTQYPSKGRGEKRRILINGAATEGRAKCRTFPFATFEGAMLKRLREVDPAEVVGKDDGPDEVMALSGQMARIESSISLIEADMNEHGESPTLFKRLRDREQAKKDLAARLADARQRAASPLSEAWGQFGTLLDAIQNAPDPRDARLRLRSILRRVVSEIRLLVVPRGAARICVVQVWFVDDGCRSYLILHKAAKSNGHGRTEGGYTAQTMKKEDGAGLDLRKPDRAAKLAAKLEALESWDCFAEGDGGAK